MMTTMLIVLCVFSGALFIYPYAGYPLLLGLLSRRFPVAGAGAVAPRTAALPASHPTQAPTETRTDWPTVALVIAAHNEAGVIADKLENATSLDYPGGQLAIYVMSDASTDDTDAIVRQWAARDSRVRLVRQEERQGKTAGLNLALEQITADFVVFSDANALYAPDALRQLITPFADSAVGYVVGAQLYTPGEQASNGNSDEGLYWDMELKLKALESEFHSVVGGDGAIYAIRRELYWPMEPDDINDFVNPLQIIAAGYRGVFNPAASCSEEAASSSAREFRRKRRIVNRSWRAVRRYGRRLSWAQHRRYLFMLISHKVLRWFAIPVLCVFFASALALAALDAGWIFELAVLAVLAAVLMGLLGWILELAGRAAPGALRVPYYFLLVHIAAFLGVIDEYRGVRHTVWSHVRDQK